MKYDTARPYAAAFVALINDKGEILLVKRATTGWMDGFYGLPSGKVEKKEGFSSAAVREAKEEVGIEVLEKDLEFKVVMWRNEDDDQDMEWIDVLFQVRHWTGEPYNAEPDVHSEIGWFPLDALPENTVPSVRMTLLAMQNQQAYIEKDDFKQSS